MRLPKLLPPFKELRGVIGIGVNEDLDSWNKIFQGFQNIHTQFPQTSLSIYAKKSPFKLRVFSSQVSLKISEKPELNLIQDLKQGFIKGAIRGSFSSTDFLQCVMQEFSVSRVNRIALLESATGHHFWFAPVGIDEGNTYESRRDFVEFAIRLLETCQVLPNIGILSKGRRGDAKRATFIKESLEDNQRLVEEIARAYPGIIINHDEILLENTILKQRNFVLAPDGVSGNLIYRTLVHLGQGKAYGAVYRGKPLEQYAIIDTSRSGSLEEIEGAMILALVFGTSSIDAGRNETQVKSLETSRSSSREA